MPRAPRRPPVAPAVAGALAAALAGALSGCAGIGQPAPYDSPGINGLVVPTPTPDPADFDDAVDNPWLPLEPGDTWTYDVTEDGRVVGSIERTVLDGPTDVGGLSATGVATATDIDGATDVATRYYAQDADGNVWVVGADAGGDGRGDWRAGVNGAEAGLAMPADPRLGDGWVTYRVPGGPVASTTIEEQAAEQVQTLERASGQEGVQEGVQEGGEADTTTRTVYEKGVGLVGVEDLDAGWTAVLTD